MDSTSCGCAKRSSLERNVESILNELNCKYKKEYTFHVSQLRDKIKDEYCKTHNIPLLRLPYYLNKEEMKNEIEKVI